MKQTDYLSDPGNVHGDSTGGMDVCSCLAVSSCVGGCLTMAQSRVHEVLSHTYLRDLLFNNAGLILNLTGQESKSVKS
jgi:hypothetical protein